MQIVIDIPEETYEYWKTHKHEYVISEAIINGIVLPKGHGRLIDADIGKEVMLSEMCGTGYQSMAVRVLDSEIFTPTIIPADEGK